MSVKDHGIEALRKSISEVTSGDKSEYYVLTKIKDAIAGSFEPSGLNIGGRILVQQINSTNWTALPLVPLTNRNAICIQNRSGVEVAINYTDTELGFVGIRMDNGAERYYDIKDSIILYAKSSSGIVDLIIEELA